MQICQGANATAAKPPIHHAVVESILDGSGELRNISLTSYFSNKQEEELSCLQERDLAVLCIEEAGERLDHFVFVLIHRATYNPDKVTNNVKLTLIAKVILLI